MINYFDKYNKYKNKYLQLNNQFGGKSNTFVEFITENIKTIKVNLDNEMQINEILNKYLLNIPKLLCLDFHGVADLYKDDEIIPSNIQKCIISYIGGSPKTIKNTIETIRPRIQNKEILLGIIVYNKNTNPICGTKGWIISKILNINKIMNIIFIDDSMKNIQCIENVGSPNIKTYFINKNKEPKKYLSKLLYRIK